MTHSGTIGCGPMNRLKAPQNVRAHPGKLTIGKPEQIRHGKPPVVYRLESDLLKSENPLINGS